MPYKGLHRGRDRAMTTKKQRQIVWDKSGGYCWYCGCELPEKGWHIDHLEPVVRYDDIEMTDTGYRRVKKLRNPEKDTIENYVPSCKECNLFKGVFSVEDFRKEIEKQVERARRYSVNYRNAERFGLVKVVKESVLFWYEREL